MTGWAAWARVPSRSITLSQWMPCILDVSTPTLDSVFMSSSSSSPLLAFSIIASRTSVVSNGGRRRPPFFSDKRWCIAQRWCCPGAGGCVAGRGGAKARRGPQRQRDPQGDPPTRIVCVYTDPNVNFFLQRRPPKVFSHPQSLLECFSHWPRFVMIQPLHRGS